MNLAKEREMSDIRRRAIKGLRAGDRFTLTRTFTEADMSAFGRITRDFNPVHYDRRFAEAKNFRDRICHGLLVAGLLTEIGGQVGWLASGMNFRFKKPVYFGDTITCTLKIKTIDAAGRATAESIFRNQSDQIVLEAELAGYLPNRSERAIMQTSIDPEAPALFSGAAEGQ
jgi:acyl dehydratase